MNKKPKTRRRKQRFSREDRERLNEIRRFEANFDCLNRWGIYEAEVHEAMRKTAMEMCEKRSLRSYVS